MLPIRELDHLWWFMSHHSILWWTIPHPHRRDRILLVMFPLRRHPATARWLTSSTCKESRTWFGHLVVGVRGGDIPLVGGRQRLLLRAPHPRLDLRGGPLVPPWQGGLLGGAVVVISSSWRGGSILSTFWGPHSYTGGGRPTAHLWLSPVCGALRNVHPISDGTGEGPAKPESRVAAVPSGTFSGSSLYRGHQSVLRGPDDPNLVYIG